jgi:hypothetical protein
MAARPFLAMSPVQPDLGHVYLFKGTRECGAK